MKKKNQTLREIKKAGRSSNEGDASGAKKDDKKEGYKLDLSAQQAVAVLGIALIAMGEDIGSQMCLRMFGHLVSYFLSFSFLWGYSSKQFVK